MISLKTGGLIIAAVILLAALAVFIEHWRARRLMNNLDKMLDAAISGSFMEQKYDETRLSSLESKLDRYLSASEVSSQNLAAEKDKIKQLIADISHQTKLPIANVLLYSQLLAEQDLPAESQNCVTALRSQSEKLSFLVTSLIKLSRLETGILSLHPKETAVKPMLDELEMQFASKSDSKQISLTFEAPEDIQAVFDIKWTAEALGNLIDNAIKYTPNGGRVAVKVQPYDLFCRVDVTDTGIGITEAEQAKVFSRFYRSQAVDTEEGIGLGLYLTRQILSEEGGYLKLISTPGTGSVFSAFLPRG